MTSAPPLNASNVPSELQCPICFGVPLRPILTKCEHVFCKECFEHSLEVQPSCPICREDCHGLNDTKPLQPGTALYRIWSGILVKCPHEGDCLWTGAISEAAYHLSTHMFEIRTLEKMELFEEVQDLRIENQSKNLRIDILEHQVITKDMMINRLQSTIANLQKQNKQHQYDNNTSVSKIAEHEWEIKELQERNERLFHCIKAFTQQQG